MSRYAWLLLAAAPAAARADDPVRVACVGDSITYGHGVKNRDTQSYPAVLGVLLGDDYDVKNFGVSGRTMLANGDAPYVKEKAFQQALKFDPNIVIIKLGTNDTKPDNWKHESEFEADCKALVEKFQAGKAKPKVYLCTPVPAFPGEWGISDARIRDGVVPKVKKVADDMKLPVIDLYEELAGRKSLFPDKVHPDAAGLKRIATAVQKAITEKK